MACQLANLYILAGLEWNLFGFMFHWKQHSLNQLQLLIEFWICFFFISRNQGSGRSENEQEKYVRLFVIVPKGLSEEELRAEFSKYGEIDGITMIRDKVTRECKGFAYVKYFK